MATATANQATQQATQRPLSPIDAVKQLLTANQNTVSRELFRVPVGEEIPISKIAGVNPRYLIVTASGDVLIAVQVERLIYIAKIGDVVETSGVNLCLPNELGEALGVDCTPIDRRLGKFGRNDSGSLERVPGQPAKLQA
jgi:hypothetical protein